MSRYALPCIACGRELQNVDIEVEINQPYNGTAFITHGHYGSTIFDPMDGHYLELNVCDMCLALHHERVMIGRDKRPVTEINELIGLPHVTGWENCNYKLVRWFPTRKEIDHAIETTIKESCIYPVDEADD